MSFQDGFTAKIGNVGSGELMDSAHINLAALKYEDGLVVGRFAKLDAGSLDNLDGSVTPVIAGVVIRDIAAALESGGVINKTLLDEYMVMYCTQGLITVDVKPGVVPVVGNKVFVSNAGDEFDGMALDVGGIATDSKFVLAIDATTWVVNVK